MSDRLIGIKILSKMNVPTEVQGVMFQVFMAKFTPEEREEYIAQWDAIDQNDAKAVEMFVTTMVGMLTG